MADNAVDSIQARLAQYAHGLHFDDLPANVVHAAKSNVIDTLGVLISGFHGEPCRIARNLAAQMPNPQGATLVGTRIKTMPEMAAFVNAITTRYPEMSDSYHRPGSARGHAGDAVTPVLAAAEQSHASGREFITAVVLNHEVFCRISDAFRGPGFDSTNFACLSGALASGKVLGLPASQLSHCISMAVVGNNILRQVRTDHLSMFKVAASGQAGRAAVFAALLARAGMEGPHLPFEGKAGWCAHVAGGRFSLETMGGEATSVYKILDTMIKNRPAAGGAIASILAAERIARRAPITGINRITVEVHKFAKRQAGQGEHLWNPDSRETADHSIPYLVAAALIDGRVTLRSYNDAHLRDPTLRALMRKVEVIENDEFTRAFELLPQQHRARVTVLTITGEQHVGEAGGDPDDLSARRSDAQIEDKFLDLTAEFLGTKRVSATLELLWNLEYLSDVAVLPAAFAVA